MKISRRFLVIAALLVLFGLFSALFHHHIPEDSLESCVSCHYIKHLPQINLGLIALAVALLWETRVIFEPKDLFNFLFQTNLPARAPPVLA